jgi:secernin
MCDTMVALGSVTKSGRVLFAKNSDREPNEPQILLRIPRKRHDLGACPKLKATYIELEQVEETNEIVISKPSWMWGCEMGFNEHSLMIGNEAVFTKEANGKPALTGMDMIRLALERTKTAKEAADYIVLLLERYGQGGNCGYTHKMLYHNSFIVADKNEAYVLETAGKYWAMKKVADYYTISNGLTLESDFDGCHPGLASGGVNFRKRCSEPLYTKFSGCRQRRALSMELLGRNKGSITVETMMEALSSHQEGHDDSFRQGSMRDLCMHAGSLVSSQTTASLVGDLNKGDYWYTGSSLPCVSVFKPFAFGSDFALFGEDEQDQGIGYWTKRETLARMLLTGRLDGAEYKKERDAVQKTIFDIYHSADIGAMSKEEAGDVLRKCAEADNAFVEEMLKRGRAAGAGNVRGNLYFRRYWKKANVELKGGL